MSRQLAASVARTHELKADRDLACSERDRLRQAQDVQHYLEMEHDLVNAEHEVDRLVRGIPTPLCAVRVSLSLPHPQMERLAATVRQRDDDLAELAEDLSGKLEAASGEADEFREALEEERGAREALEVDLDEVRKGARAAREAGGASRRASPAPGGVGLARRGL